MKTIAISLTLSVACGSLILAGCSKSNKSEPVALNTNNPAVSSANGGAAGAGPIALKIKWQTGKKYDMEMDLNQTTDMNISDKPIHEELRITQGIQYLPVKDLDNGGHQVEMKFDSQKFDLARNGKEVVNYDSAQNTTADTNSAAVAAIMHAMLGVPIDYTFAADGTLEKIDGVDSLTSRIAAAEPDQRQRMALEQLYDQDTLKQFYGSFSQPLPDHPVKIGESWSSSQDITSPTGVMTMDGTYTFKDWEQHNGHNCVHLLVTGDIKTKTAPPSPGGEVVKIEKGIMTGDVWFDPDLGMIVDSNTGLDMTLNITTQSMAITQNMNQNVRMSLQGIDP